MVGKKPKRQLQLADVNLEAVCQLESGHHRALDHMKRHDMLEQSAMLQIIARQRQTASGATLIFSVGPAIRSKGLCWVTVSGQMNC